MATACFFYYRESGSIQGVVFEMVPPASAKVNCKSSEHPTPPPPKNKLIGMFLLFSVIVLYPKKDWDVCVVLLLIYYFSPNPPAVIKLLLDAFLILV